MVLLGVKRGNQFGVQREWNTKLVSVFDEQLTISINYVGVNYV